LQRHPAFGKARTVKIQKLPKFSLKIRIFKNPKIFYFLFVILIFYL